MRTKSAMTNAVKSSPMTRAAASAMVMDSSIVIPRSRRFLKASLKIGQPPIKAVRTPITLTRGNGSHNRNQTAVAPNATTPIRVTHSNNHQRHPPTRMLARDYLRRAVTGLVIVFRDEVRLPFLLALIGDVLIVPEMPRPS